MKRDLADVSMNVQLKDLARASPSIDGVLVCKNNSACSKTRTMCENLTLAFQIALVANKDHGAVVLVLDAQDLLLEGGNFLKALTGGDGVDKQEAFASAHILFAHGHVLFLASGI